MVNVLYALLAISVVALGEGGALWYLWRRWRSAQDEVAVAGAVSSGLQVQLSSAYEDLAAARQALAKQNAVEAQHDATVVAAAPALADALARINGLH